MVQHLVLRQPQPGLTQNRDRLRRTRIDRLDRRRANKIDTNADGQMADLTALPGAFQQDPRHLATVQQHVVRPFQPDRHPRPAEITQCISQCQSRDKTS